LSGATAKGKLEFLMRSHLIAALLFVFAACVFSTAQNSLDPGAAHSQSPTVVFEQDWNVADPAWYQVSVSSSGEAQYQSKSRQKENEEATEPYNRRFIVSASTRDEIFQLTKSLNDFQGNFETRAKVAQTGTKTLKFKDGARETSTSLNYSDNPSMNQLIGIFQRISTTFELAQKLDFDIRFDKLGLDRDLKNLEHLATDKQVAELQVISPMLERIANDNGIMNIARQRARRLLDKSRPQGAQP
jgi:hypothetical protein